MRRYETDRLEGAYYCPMPATVPLSGVRTYRKRGSASRHQAAPPAETTKWYDASPTARLDKTCCPNTFLLRRGYVSG
jgi:hypothetical protein